MGVEKGVLKFVGRVLVPLTLAAFAVGIEGTGPSPPRETGREDDPACPDCPAKPECWANKGCAD